MGCSKEVQTKAFGSRLIMFVQQVQQEITEVVRK